MPVKRLEQEWTLNWSHCVCVCVHTATKWSKTVSLLHSDTVIIWLISNPCIIHNLSLTFCRMGVVVIFKISFQPGNSFKQKQYLSFKCLLTKVLFIHFNSPPSSYPPDKPSGFPRGNLRRQDVTSGVQVRGFYSLVRFGTSPASRVM